MNEFHYLEGREAMAREAGEFLAEEMAAVLRGSGILSLALAGGSSPRGAYEVLARAEGLDWARVHVFFSDERLVPLDSPDSNFRMAQEALLSRAPIPKANLHPVRTDAKSPEEAARGYELEIREHFGALWPEIPRFDVLILGMGADGHTASLFPGSPALGESVRLVVPVSGQYKSPPLARVSFSLPLINAARLVVFIVAGAEKLPLVKAIEAGDGEAWPAALVRPEGGLVWFTAP